MFTWFPIHSLTFSVTDERESRQWQVWRLQWKNPIFCIELDTSDERMQLQLLFDKIVYTHDFTYIFIWKISYRFTWFPIYSLTFSVTDERESRQWQVWRLQWKNPIFCIELDTSDERMQLQLLFSEKVMKEKKNSDTIWRDL